jgi:hypothetical protein
MKVCCGTHHKTLVPFYRFFLGNKTLRQVPLENKRHFLWRQSEAKCNLSFKRPFSLVICSALVKNPRTKACAFIPRTSWKRKSLSLPVLLYSSFGNPLSPPFDYSLNSQQNDMSQPTGSWLPGVETHRPSDYIILEPPVRLGAL